MSLNNEVPEEQLDETTVGEAAKPAETQVDVPATGIVDGDIPADEPKPDPFREKYVGKSQDELIELLRQQNQARAKTQTENKEYRDFLKSLAEQREIE
jgi:hypothetical protein